MPYDDVQKFSEAAVNKAKLLKEHPGKYFLRAVMAGFFIVVAMIFSNVVGNTFQSTDPAWGKLLGGIVFAIAVLLIVFIGAELFTGNNLVMAFYTGTGRHPDCEYSTAYRPFHNLLYVVYICTQMP